MLKLASLRQILEKESFPIDFPIKFVGKNSADFSSGVDALRGRFPKLVLSSDRESNGARHRAFGFMFRADSADEIIQVIGFVAEIPDVVMQL